MTKFTLREWRPKDANAFYEIARQPQVQKFMSDGFPTTKLAIQNWIDRAVFEDKTKSLTYCIDIGGTAVGTVNTKKGVDVFSPTAFLGYWLNPNLFGKGIITSAVKQIVLETFQTLDVQRIQAEVFAGNTGSMKVLLKNNFQLETIQKNAVFKNNKLIDYYIFALLREN